MGRGTDWPHRSGKILLLLLLHSRSSFYMHTSLQISFCEKAGAGHRQEKGFVISGTSQAVHRLVKCGAVGGTSQATEIFTIKDLA